MRRLEILVAFEWQFVAAESNAAGLDLGTADIPELRESLPEIAEAKVRRENLPEGVGGNTGASRVL